MFAAFDEGGGVAQFFGGSPHFQLVGGADDRRLVEDLDGLIALGDADAVGRFFEGVEKLLLTQDSPIGRGDDEVFGQYPVERFEVALFREAAPVARTRSNTARYLFPTADQTMLLL